MGMCAECPLNPRAEFERVKKHLGVDVTPELHRFCLRMFGLEEELETFGEAGPITEFERAGILVLKQERAKHEAYRLKHPEK